MTINEPPTATAQAIPEEGSGDISMADLPSATSVSGGVNSPNASSQPPAAVVPPPAMATMNWNASDVGIPMHERTKLGAICCGCCCDFRRAVIIVDSVIIGLSAYTMVGLLAYDDYETSDGYTDEPTLDDSEPASSDGQLPNAIIGGLEMVLTVVPLYGAFMYRVPMLWFGVFVQVASFVARFSVSYFVVERAEDLADEFYFAYTVEAIITALFIYPHVGYIMEINQGIMLPETYPREEYCCCCGTKPRPPPQHHNHQPNSQQPAYPNHGSLVSED